MPERITVEYERIYIVKESRRDDELEFESAEDLCNYLKDHMPEAGSFSWVVVEDRLPAEKRKKRRPLPLPYRTFRKRG